MTTKEIEIALERANGGPFIKVSTLAQFLGDSNLSRVRKKYLCGLQRISGRYFVPEVAQRIKEHVTT